MKLSLAGRGLLAVTVLLLLLLCRPLAVRAEDDYVAYPPLPAGYSSIKVYDRHGRFAGRILPEERRWVTLDRIPRFLQEALIAIEDARFYEHGGIDLRGIARALVKDVVSGRLVEGGSTITQQLVKNKHLSAEKTIDRKVQEGLLAMEYEKKYSKQQILEMYFNEIYFGNGAWGLAQAARLYFDKNPEELNDGECAVLAGVPKNPGRYNPWGKPEDVALRRNLVLARMKELRLITPAREQTLRAERVKPVRNGEAPQYLAHLRRKLVEWYGPQVIDDGGLDITAALDIDLQKLAEKTLKEGVERLGPDLQGALLCIDPHTGDVLAVAGGLDFPKSTYNRAFFAQRQPGSAIKPLIYAAALEQGATAASRWDDTPVAYDRGNRQSWTPRNYRGEVFGSLTLRDALAHSNNVITVKLLDIIGVPYFVEFARGLGLPLRTPNDLSLALGTDEVTLHDLVLAYTPLATGGLQPKARTVLRIHDRKRGVGADLPLETVPVLSPGAAYITTRILQDVLTTGTAKSLKKFAAERPAAGKTGTTDDYRDAWFIGYTPQLVAGVWVGHDTPKPEGRGFTGGAVAAPIWERFMRRALAQSPATDFPQPDTVLAVAIDPRTGYLATDGCPEIRDEYYISGTEPAAYCPEHAGDPVAPAPPPAATAP
ncbi:MAG: PBP1A family penicillin-binding protein [Deltaproteobacteria bacterium]|nr:MAG: PBP1A family penicillin-binding protein [Deltaproteobacteria bacterium]